MLEVIEKKYSNVVENSYEKAAEEKEFMELLRQEIKTWRSKVKKEQERVVLEAIIVLMYNSDMVEILSKKRNISVP